MLVPKLILRPDKMKKAVFQKTACILNIRFRLLNLDIV